MATKSVEYQIRKARKLMDDADHKFALGENMDGSAKVWESVSQIVGAVAADRGWKHDGSPKALRDVMVKLSDELDEPNMVTCFYAVEIFRNNADIGFMEDFQLNDDRVEARLFVRRMAELVSGKFVFI